MMTLNNLADCHGMNKINSLTKYPSILTYHDLGEKGMLKEAFSENLSFKDCEKCYITEKIDGTNSRIILLNGDYFIGSRENFLYAKGDRFGDPSLGIAENVKPAANRLSECSRLKKDVLYILYGETYGGAVTAGSKNYTGNKSYGFRIFDVIQMELDQLEEVLKGTADQIASWRERGGQSYLDVDHFRQWAAENAEVETVPYISTVMGSEIPLSLSDVFDWLSQFSNTLAGINSAGKAEGVVIRNSDRSLIRKLRFEDYARTEKRGGFLSAASKPSERK